MSKALTTYQKWLDSSFLDEASRNELLDISANQNEIEDRFYKDLEFGTAGLRGVLGVGTNRMNLYTVRKTTNGLANYIKSKGIDAVNRGVVIAYDCRRMSKEFSDEASRILASMGIKAYVYNELRSTPELSFAIGHLKTISGIMITASHNPPEYNGYKVYWENGAQISSEVASDIIEAINNVDNYDEPQNVDLSKIVTLDNQIDTAYIEAIKTQRIRKDLPSTLDDSFRIVFSPLHGTALRPVLRVLEESGYRNVYFPEEQSVPNPDFPTVKSPNPEAKEAFEVGIDLALEVNASLVMATDPDGDRIGVAVRNEDNSFTLLSGNELGALLCNYLIESKGELNTIQDNSVIIKTIVSNKMGEKIARANGLEVIDTLTGFKYIGDWVDKFAKTKEKSFLLGYEESYGYLVGSHARDKDACVTALMVAEMAGYYHTLGKTLAQGLKELFDRYGYYKENLKSYTLSGKEGLERIGEIMKTFRSINLDEIGGIKVVEKKDYALGLNLPKADVVKFELEDGNSIALRPSGTEPKLKIYIGAYGDTQKAVTERLSSLCNSIDKLINPLLEV